MSAPISINQAADLVDLSIQKVFEKSAEPEQTYPKYFNVRTTEDYYEKDSSLSGLATADFVDENGVIMSDTPIQGYKKTYTQNMVAILASFTFQMWKFGIKKRDLDNTAKSLKKAIAQKKEILCAERLDNAFSQTYTHYGSSGTSKVITITGGDSLAAASASHTREDGGTVMNNIVTDGTTVNLPFDYAGLKAAHRTAGLMVDPRGYPMIPNLDTLVVKKNSANAFKAKEILKAITTGKIPESFDHDGAGVPAFTIVEVANLQNANYWFMFDSSMKTDEYGFQFIESQAPMVDPVNVVYKTKEIQTSATTLFDLGHNDCSRSWVFSNATSA